MNQNDTLQINEKGENKMKIVIQQDMWEETCTEADSVTSSNTWLKFRWKVIKDFFEHQKSCLKWGPHTRWRNCGTHTGNHTHVFWA